MLTFISTRGAENSRTIVRVENCCTLGARSIEKFKEVNSIYSIFPIFVICLVVSILSKKFYFRNFTKASGSWTKENVKKKKKKIYSKHQCPLDSGGQQHSWALEAPRILGSNTAIAFTLSGIRDLSYCIELNQTPNTCQSSVILKVTVNFVCLSCHPFQIVLVQFQWFQLAAGQKLERPWNADLLSAVNNPSDQA